MPGTMQAASRISPGTNMLRVVAELITRNCILDEAGHRRFEDSRGRRGGSIDSVMKFHGIMRWDILLVAI